ncbi:MAG TPA: ABC transporter ATP-binding protein [Phycisphaerae bacterium]|nr:ABC transporter ATP-binding protein [Phycisphaerae bacterium]
MTMTAQDLPPVQVQNLGKSFGQGKSRVNALVNVSLEVRQGEHVAVIGPSGSGKSTLLHLIAGLTGADFGRVVIAGQDLAEMKDRRLTLFRRRHIGMVFQSYNLIPTLTVEDNLRLPLLLERGRAPANGRIDALLTTLGLENRRRHRPDQLSGGEQQRVAIGRAMIADPTVILADEPTGNLDSASSRNLCKLLQRLCDEHGRTIITVTHDPAVAVWADRVMVLKDGRIVETLDTSAYDSARELGVRFLEILDRNEGADACA